MRLLMWGTRFRIPSWQTLKMHSPPANLLWLRWNTGTPRFMRFREWEKQSVYRYSLSSGLINEILFIEGSEQTSWRLLKSSDRP